MSPAEYRGLSFGPCHLQSIIFDLWAHKRYFTFRRLIQAANWESRVLSPAGVLVLLCLEHHTFWPILIKNIGFEGVCEKDCAWGLEEVWPFTSLSEMKDRVQSQERTAWHTQKRVLFKVPSQIREEAAILRFHAGFSTKMNQPQYNYAWDNWCSKSRDSLSAARQSKTHKYITHDTEIAFRRIMQITSPFFSQKHLRESNWDSERVESPFWRKSLVVTQMVVPTKKNNPTFQFPHLVETDAGSTKKFAWQR